MLESFLRVSGVPAASVLAASLCALLLGPVLLAMFTGGGTGIGNRSSCAQFMFSVFVRCGRVRNLACSSCDRSRGRYPVANTCQVPFFSSLSDVYTFVFGYKAEGLFLEIGAYDGESFSNTSGLADMGWRGHYIEPIPAYASAARMRHAGNAGRVVVHTTCIGERDGEVIELSTAGPFSSAVEDEIKTVAASQLNPVLASLGWAHESSKADRVKATTVSLNSFCKNQNIKPKEIDVMVSTGFFDMLAKRNAADCSPSSARPPFHCPSRSWMLRALSCPSCGLSACRSMRRSWSLLKSRSCKLDTARMPECKMTPRLSLKYSTTLATQSSTRTSSTLSLFTRTHTALVAPKLRHLTVETMLRGSTSKRGIMRALPRHAPAPIEEVFASTNRPHHPHRRAARCAKTN